MKLSELFEEFPLTPSEREYMASLLAHLAYCMDQSVDEDETMELFYDYLQAHKFDLYAIPELASIARSTRFVEGKDTWN